MGRGLKVVDLTRVIAGPAISRGLAELGASVMRVTAPHLSDFTGLHPDLNWGKWNCCLDLRNKEDQNKLRDLIVDADVIVDGYRPGVFDKYGFGVEGVLKLCHICFMLRSCNDGRFGRFGREGRLGMEPPNRLPVLDLFLSFSVLT